MKILFLSLIAVAVFGCAGKETRRTYYAGGQLETVSEVIGESKHGVARIYFESGQIKYEGSYQNDMRVGWHTFYYKNGNVNERTFYEISNNKELASHSLWFDQNGTLLTDFRYEKKIVDIKFSKPPPYEVNDTVRVILSIRNAKHKYCEAVAGKFDENLNLKEESKDYADAIPGNDKHEIRMKVLFWRPGLDTLTWLIRDFDYIRKSDSTGTTVGEESYVEAQISTLPQ